MVIRSGRQAFTLIEMLIVIAIITVLASLLLVGTGMLRRNALRARTLAIIQCVETGLATAASVDGLRLTPARHPLASEVAGTMAAGWSVEAAIIVAGADGIRRFSGARVAGDAPHLFGMRLEHLGVLSANAEWITPNTPPLTRFMTYETTVRNLIRTALASQFDRIASLGGILESSDSVETSWLKRSEGSGASTYERNVDAVAPIEGSWDANHRVWFPVEQGDVSVWSPGRILDELGTWRHYQLRGITLVDAWGHGLLLTSQGEALICLSPGPDGCFVIEPGPNGMLDTAESALNSPDRWPVPAGDDRDARADNIPTRFPGE